MDLSNVVDTPFEEIKAGDEILIKCKVEEVLANELLQFRIAFNNHGKFTCSCGISKDHYIGKIEYPTKVGDRYRHEHGQPLRVLLIVRDYAVMEYEQAELAPFIYGLHYLMRLEKLPMV